MRIAWLISAGAAKDRNKLRVSVIICTYGRAAVLGNLLASLNTQSYRDFETLVIDGNPQPSMGRAVVDEFLRRPGVAIRVAVVASPKGLTRQRNVGLDYATGDIFCFLDDDVSLPNDFLERVVNIFQKHGMHDVGGLTGYDTLNYPSPISLRWRLRRALGVIPKLPPGSVDRLGRGIPLSFLSPFKGFKQVGLLHGFCMIYRRVAVGNLKFDELIPTYGGEDRDFSMRVGRRCRMLICGDLRLEHHASPQGRDSELDRNFQSAYGMGRRFAKYSRGGWDTLTMIQTFAGDFAIDVLFLLSHPTRLNLQATRIRIKGFFAGLRSNVPPATIAPLLPRVDSSEQQSRHVSTNP
jgi:glycosyltransferase involved in cell wall biosynthesis